MKFKATKIFGSTIVLTLLVLVFALEGVSQLKAWQKRKLVSEEIAALTAQGQSLEQKNTELSNSLNYLNSGDFKDKIAREQLNLKLEGERVIHFTEASPNKLEAADAVKGKPMSNAGKWYKYFFN